MTDGLEPIKYQDGQPSGTGDPPRHTEGHPAEHEQTLPPPVFSMFPPCPEITCTGTLLPFGRYAGSVGVVQFDRWACTVCQYRLTRDP